MAADGGKGLAWRGGWRGSDLKGTGVSATASRETRRGEATDLSLAVLGGGGGGVQQEGGPESTPRGPGEMGTCWAGRSQETPGQQGRVWEEASVACATDIHPPALPCLHPPPLQRACGAGVGGVSLLPSEP